MLSKLFQIIVFAGIAGVWFLKKQLKRTEIPEHLLHHKVTYEKELISEEVAKELNQIVREMGQDGVGFPTQIAADLKTGVGHQLHKHIGEAQPIEADGSCKNAYLYADPKQGNCILPGRVDAGLHFIMTGGPEALREPYLQMISRISSFGKHNFDFDKYPQIKKLFAQENFQKAAKGVCPDHKQILDPMQFNFIINVPGQTVAFHMDVGYFHGATRFQFPQWLVLVMQFSGLFQDRFIEQVQAVGYLHEKMLLDDEGKETGYLVYYPENQPNPERISAAPRSGNFFDGSKTIHAAGIYRPTSAPPSMDKDKPNALFYIGNEKWELRENDKVLRTYNSSDLRIAVVYRALCFESQEKIAEYKKWSKNNENRDEEPNNLKLEDILETLKADLVKRGKLSANQKIDRLDLSVMLLKTYAKYPLPAYSEALIPWNYCALPRILHKSLTEIGNILMSPFCKGKVKPFVEEQSADL